MQALCGERLLAVWDRAQGEHELDRALTLLAAALAQHLADAPGRFPLFQALTRRRTAGEQMLHQSKGGPVRKPHFPIDATPRGPAIPPAGVRAERTLTNELPLL